MGILQDSPGHGLIERPYLQVHHDVNHDGLALQGLQLRHFGEKSKGDTWIVLRHVYPAPNWTVRCSDKKGVSTVSMVWLRSYHL